MVPLLDRLNRDRLTADALRAIYTQHGATPGFLLEVLRVLPQLDATTSCRAVYLLRLAAIDGRLESSHWGRVAAAVDSSEHWLFRLLMCQLLAVGGCPAELGAQVRPFLVRCLDDRRTIVRAWAISGLAQFQTDPAGRSTYEVQLRRARRDRSKAMQARLRYLEKQR
jgi:hypothetical protein